jgi:hypothetical protein
VLESQFGLIVDEAPGHHQVAGDPFRVVGLKGFDLVLRGAVKLLACDILVNLRRPFAVRAVGAAEVAHVGYAGRAFFLAVAAERAGTSIAAAGTVAAWTFAAVAKRLAVFSAAKAPAVAFTVPARTVTKGPVIAVTIRLTVTVPERLPLSTTKTAAVTLGVAARTVTSGPVVPVTKRLAITVPERLPLSTTKTTAVTFTVPARTITKRPVVAITIRLALSTAKATAVTFTVAARTVTSGPVVPVTIRLALSTAKATAITFTVAARTVTSGPVVPVTKRLPVAVPERLPLSTTKTTTIALAVAARTVPEGLPLSTAGCTPRGVGVVPVGAGPESAGFAAGVVVSAEPAAVIPAAVAAVVLSHVDSSCCEPTTGAIAAARIRVSFSTQPEIKRFEVRTSSSILVELPPRAGPAQGQGSASWPYSHRRRAIAP